LFRRFLLTAAAAMTAMISFPATAGDEATRTVTVRGRVLDHKGRALPKANVWLPLRWEPDRQVQGQADERGQFELTFPSDWLHPVAVYNRYVVWAHAKGHTFGKASAQAVLFERAKEPVEVKLEPATRSSIVVLDPDGKPVRGATVSPYHWPDSIVPLVAGVTDEEGRARLPAVASAELFSVRAATQEYGIQRFESPHREIPTEQTIRLRPVGRLEAQVFGEKREWLGGIKLEFENLKEGTEQVSGFATAETDAEGKFVVPHLAGGQPFFRVRLDQRLPVRAWAPAAPQIVAGKTTTLTIDLVPGVIVRGKVQFESGKPLAGGYVRVYYGVLRQSDEVLTDAMGRFEARVLPGEVHQSIHVAGPFEQPLVQRSGERVTIPEGVKEFDLPAIRMAKTIRYEGRLIDNDGKGVAEADVFGMDGSRSRGYARTDAEGKFVIRLPADIESFRVRVKDANYQAMLEKTDPLVLKLPVAIK
jgi:hypothetical protein